MIDQKKKKKKKKGKELDINLAHQNSKQTTKSKQLKISHLRNIPTLTDQYNRHATSIRTSLNESVSTAVGR